jgi:hypothetical protein
MLRMGSWQATLAVRLHFLSRLRLHYGILRIFRLSTRYLNPWAWPNRFSCLSISDLTQSPLGSVISSMTVNVYTAALLSLPKPEVVRSINIWILTSCACSSLARAILGNARLDQGPQSPSAF